MKPANCFAVSSEMTSPKTFNAARYARAFLRGFGLDHAIDIKSDHPALSWRRCGIMAVTGKSDKPNRMQPAAMTTAADGALLALKAVSSGSEFSENGSVYLGQRARLRGDMAAMDMRSPGGACHLLQTRSGVIAFNLARPDDWDLVPAWIEKDCARNIEALQKKIKERDGAALVARGRDIGLAVAESRVPSGSGPWWTFTGETRRNMGERSPVIAGLGALWAGPLAAHLLGRAGGRVIKVESTTRPDGSRAHADFFAALNANKQMAAFDFTSADGRSDLKRLLSSADIVIEASRPRALQQVGIIAEDLCAQKPGKIWVSITAHGRSGAAASHIGFGDDVAVAGGLSAHMARAHGIDAFCGDAIADPLTGLHVAAAAQALWSRGRGGLLAVSMSQLIAYICREDAEAGCPSRTARWQAMAEADIAALYPLPNAGRTAGDIGVDTLSVLAELPC